MRMKDESGCEYEIRMVSLSDMVEGAEYQRQYSPAKERALARVFSQSACQRILLSCRDDGTLHIIDGRHTRNAAVARGITELSCKVLFGLSLEKEAYLFELCNTKRARPMAIEIFKSRLIRKEPIAQRILAICDEHGFLITPSPHCRFQTKAVGSLESILFMDDDGELLGRTLEMIGTIWPDENRNGEAKLLLGLSLLLSRLEPGEQMRKTIIRKLQTTPLLSVYRAAKAKQEIDGQNAREAVASALLLTINKNRRAKLTLKQQILDEDDVQD